MDPAPEPELKLDGPALSRVLPVKQGAPLNIYRSNQAINSSWWGEKGVFKRVRSVYSAASNFFRPPTRDTPEPTKQLNCFQAQSIRVPLPASETLLDGELSVGEVCLEMITMRHAQDRALDKYAESGGVLYPHIMVPDIGFALKMSFVKQAPSRWDSWFPEKTENSRYGQAIEAPENLPVAVSPLQGIFSLFWSTPNPFAKIPKSLQIPPEARVSSIAWHKYLSQFSVSLKDDKIYTYDLKKNGWKTLVLSHQFQNDIYCSEWRPNKGGMLAVGCRYGVCLWTVKQVEKDLSSSGTSMLHLQHAGFSPITCLCWSPCGRYLAIGSPNCSHVLLWDVSLGTHSLLEPALAGGVTVLSWAPNGNYLFAGGTGGIFRIWETMLWRHQAWNYNADVCQSACWSGDSCHLALCFSDESVIHFLRFSSSPPAIDASYVLASLVSEYMVNTTNEPFPVCGRIQSIVWDCSSSRLAVAFQDTPLIATFQTNSHPSLGVHPLGFIRGPAKGGQPRLLHFCPQFKRGALLTNCWENGKISFFPLYFKSIE